MQEKSQIFIQHGRIAPVGLYHRKHPAQVFAEQRETPWRFPRALTHLAFPPMVLISPLWMM